MEAVRLVKAGAFDYYQIAFDCILYQYKSGACFIKGIRMFLYLKLMRKRFLLENRCFIKQV